jgi:hypothetical protein
MIHTKTSYFLAAILLIPFVNGYAQLQEADISAPEWKVIGELRWINTVKAKLQYIAHGHDTTYRLYLQDEPTLKNNRDLPVHQYFSILFESEGNSLTMLQQLLLSFFDSDNGRNKKTFRLGNTLVSVQHAGKITSKAILLATQDGAIYLSKSEVKKLLSVAN